MLKTHKHSFHVSGAFTQHKRAAPWQHSVKYHGEPKQNPHPPYFIRHKSYRNVLLYISSLVLLNTPETIRVLGHDVRRFEQLSHHNTGSRFLSFYTEAGSCGSSADSWLHHKLTGWVTGTLSESTTGAVRRGVPVAPAYPSAAVTDTVSAAGLCGRVLVWLYLMGLRLRNDRFTFQRKCAGWGAARELQRGNWT